jgi:integrase
MAILAECPRCHRKQKTKNKVCAGCGNDLDKAKRSKAVKYWITYRLPGGKQKSEMVDCSIKEAKDADGKRKVQKREGRIFEILTDSEMTFVQLSEWYKNLASVKKLASYYEIKSYLKMFNEINGDKVLSDFKLIDLENYQVHRSGKGIKAVSIDAEIARIKTMVTKAFDNDLIGGQPLKAFRRLKKLSKPSDRTRDRIITLVEYLRLLDAATPYLKGMLILLMHTGMRPGERKMLKWEYIDHKAGFIRLPATITKEKQKRTIPINHHVQTVFDNTPRHIHHDYVFTYRNQPIIRKGSWEGFAGCCKRAGIPYGKKIDTGIVPHDFRRTFKTNCMKAGVDKVLRDSLVGHSLKGMDAHYIKPTEDDLGQAMDRYTAWFDAEVSANVDQTLTKIT